MYVIGMIVVLSLVVVFYKDRGLHLSPLVEGVLYNTIQIDEEIVKEELQEVGIQEENVGVYNLIHANMNLDSPVEVTKQLLEMGVGK